MRTCFRALYQQKKEIGIIQSLSLKVGVDGLATTQINLLRLTPFRYARRGALTNPQIKNYFIASFCLYTYACK